MNFKIKHIDNVQGTIEIDWLNGITLIHNIPLYILENPGLSQERIVQELEYMRPPIPEPIEVPETLLNLVEEPEPEHLADAVRFQRDTKIEEVRWRIERHRDELDLGLEPTEPLEPLLQYVQALRDAPQQEGFPEDVDLPTLE